jgi:hypothetical protein
MCHPNTLVNFQHIFNNLNWVHTCDTIWQLKCLDWLRFLTLSSNGHFFLNGHFERIPDSVFLNT